jgi:hypothetical protein
MKSSYIQAYKNLRNGEEWQAAKESGKGIYDFGNWGSRKAISLLIPGGTLIDTYSVKRIAKKRYVNEIRRNFLNKLRESSICNIKQEPAC